MCQVDSEADETAWEPSTDAQAFANLRSLVRAYIRREVSEQAFIMQFGLIGLQHDVATPRPPGALEPPAEPAKHCDGCNCLGENDLPPQDIFGLTGKHAAADGKQSTPSPYDMGYSE